MTREPVVANMFYPGNKDTLERMLDKMLKGAPKPTIPGRIVAIAVPHAGYEYSGATAAAAYNALTGTDVNTVVLLGPSHRAWYDGIAVYSKGAWKTPLGNVEVDEALAAELLRQDPAFRDLPQAQSQEHSLEVQVPFLQKTLKNFKIVPIGLCDSNYAQLELLGKALARIAKDKNVLLLASTDLYHGESYTDCQRSDAVTLGFIERFDPTGLHRALLDGSASACGGLPVVALMIAARELGADRAQVLARTNSNDVTGERGGYCVGYGAAVFFEGKTGATGTESEGLLNNEEQQELVRIARTTIDTFIRTGKTPSFKPLTKRLEEPRGVFVTLHERGQLRGCIGYIEPIKPVYEAVREMAVESSTGDPRFNPVTERELSAIDIEVTVLTPMRRTTDPLKEIVLGRHGIVVKRGMRQGVFLPQVATETGWSTEEFLSQCAAGKAGLPPDAWKDKSTEVYIFEGQVFGEKDN